LDGNFDDYVMLILADHNENFDVMNDSYHVVNELMSFDSILIVEENNQSDKMLTLVFPDNIPKWVKEQFEMNYHCLMMEYEIQFQEF
jgi:hypothetical protein